MKKDLVLFNPRPNSIYVHLDQLLFDLKYDPSIIEIPVPKYFKEEDRIEVELLFKEKPERDTKKKKKAKKKKKKKGKVTEEVKPIPRLPVENENFVNSRLLDQWKTNEPELEIVHDPFTLDMNIEAAIRLIQKNERGRQYRQRYQDFVKKWVNTMMEKNRKNEGKQSVQITTQEKENQASEFIQRRIRGILARKNIELMRQDEMVFLGMQRQPPRDEEKS